MSREEAERAGAARLRRGVRAPLKVMLPTAAALGAGAAVAIGSIPGSDGTITGCYYTIPANQGGDYPYGTLRVIDPSQTTAVDPNVYQCTPNERTITWNQRGPMGPQGQTGQQGQPGQPAQIIGESTFSIASNKYDKVYLELDGVRGDTSKGWIPVEQFNLGGGGAITDGKKVTISAFDVTKKADDAANAALLKDYSMGTVIHSAKIFFVDKKGTVVTYNVDKLQIASLSEGSGDNPNESISFTFGKVDISYDQGKSQVSTGWSSGKTLSGFDLTTISSK